VTDTAPGTATLQRRRQSGVGEDDLDDDLDDDVAESSSNQTVDDEVDARVDRQAEIAESVDSAQRVQRI